MADIRKARRDDIEHLVRMGAALSSEAPEFAGMAYNHDKVRRLLTTLHDSPHGFVMVAEDGGQIAGLMVAAATEHWAFDALVAFDLALYVAPGQRGARHGAALLKAYAQWCRDVGAVRGTAGVSTGIHPDATGQLYESVGARRVGGIFDVMEV